MPRGSVLATLPENLVITLDSKSPPREGIGQGCPVPLLFLLQKKPWGSSQLLKKKSVLAFVFWQILAPS